MNERRFILLSTTIALAAATPAAAGILPHLGAVVALSVASCAAAFAIAAATGLDKLFVPAAPADPSTVIADMVRCAEHAAKHGVGALDSLSLHRRTPGLRRGLQLIHAGSDPDAIRAALERELDALLERRARGTWTELLAAAAPTLGAVFACSIIIGLVASGGALTGLGTGAAAGVFGGLLACLLAMTLRPTSPAELAQREAADVLARTIVNRAVVLIASGAPPLEVEQTLRTLMPPRHQAETQLRHAA